VEIQHLRAKHVSELTHYLLVPCVVLQTNFRLNLHSARTDVMETTYECFALLRRHFITTTEAPVQHSFTKVYGETDQINK